MEMIDRENLKIDLEGDGILDLIRNNKDIFLFLKEDSQRKVYSFSTGFYYEIMHNIFKHEDIFILESKYDYKKQLSFIRFLISQYIKMCQDGLLGEQRIVIFDFNDDFSKKDFIDKNGNGKNILLRSVQFNKEIYQNLFISPKATNPVVWYHFIAQIIKAIFKLDESEVIEIETIFLNNDPFTDFISQKKCIDELYNPSGIFKSKYISIIYHLLYQINYHTHFQPITEENIFIHNLEEINDKIILVKFPITIPIFLRKIISYLFITKFIVNNYVKSNSGSNLTFILSNPSINFSVDILKYDIIPLIYCLIKRNKEKVRFIFYNSDEDFVKHFPPHSYLMFEFIRDSIAKFHFPQHLKIKKHECVGNCFNKYKKKIENYPVLFLNSPVYLNLHI